MHYVGIDWADTSHQLAILTPEGCCVSEWTINHTDEAIRQLCAQFGCSGSRCSQY